MVDESYKIVCKHCGEVTEGPFSRTEWARWLSMSIALMHAHLIAPIDGLKVKGNG